MKIKGLPDEALAMGREYNLTAVMDDGEELPITFSRVRKDGKMYNEVHVLHFGGGRKKFDSGGGARTEEGALPEWLVNTIEKKYKEYTGETTKFVKLHKIEELGDTSCIEAIIERGGKRYRAKHITVEMVDGEPLVKICPSADDEL